MNALWRLGLGLVDDQLPVLHVVAERRKAAHPHPLRSVRSPQGLAEPRRRRRALPRPPRPARRKASSYPARAKLSAPARPTSPIPTRAITPIACSGRSVAARRVGGGGQNSVRRLLRNHIDRADDEEAGDAGKDAGVDHSQAACSVNAKIRVQNPVALDRADRAGAGGMVAPGMGPDELFERLVRQRAAGRVFRNKARPAVPSRQSCRGPAGPHRRPP